MCTSEEYNTIMYWPWRPNDAKVLMCRPTKESKNGKVEPKHGRVEPKHGRVEPKYGSIRPNLAAGQQVHKTSVMAIQTPNLLT